MDPTIRDMELLDFLAGRLSAERDAALQAQLQQDVALRKRLDTLRAVWRGMDLPDEDAHIDRLAGIDLRAVVRRRLAEDRRNIRRPMISWRRALAAAALWIVAIGLGTTTALLLPTSSPSSQTAEKAPTDLPTTTADDLTEELYYDTLGSLGESDLAALFTDWDDQLDTEGS